MGSADRIERERLAKRARILDAARELFIERGVDAVTLREVAQRIEYSTTAIYVQFKDKQDLLDQMVREDFGKFAGALQRAAAVADPVARLDRLGQEYVEFALTMPRHYQLLFMTPIGADHKHDAVAAPERPPGIDGYDLLLRTVTDCVAAGRLRPEHTDPAALAQVIWANVHGLASLLIAMGDVAEFAWRPRATLVELGLDVIMRGVLRDPGDHRRRRPKRKPRPRAT